MQNEPKNQVQAEEFLIPIKIWIKTDLKTPRRTAFSCSRSFSSSILRLDDQFYRIDLGLDILLYYCLISNLVIFSIE